MTDTTTEQEAHETAEKRKRRELIEALRETATFLEEHPGVEVITDNVDLRVWMSSKERIADQVRALGRADKTPRDNWYEVTRQIGPIQLGAWTSRGNVCERRVVGTEKVVEKVPVDWEEREVENEIVEWDCGDPLLAPSKET